MLEGWRTLDLNLGLQYINSYFCHAKAIWQKSKPLKQALNMEHIKAGKGETNILYFQIL